MTRSSQRGAIAALVLGAPVVVHSSQARADTPASRLQLSYEAPAGCPSRRDFVASLSPRIQASWIDGSDTRSFDVRVVREGGTFAGQLVIRQQGRAPNTREIRGGSCKAVTMSLVVFVAIALDPASEAPASDEAEPTAEAESPPAVETTRPPGEVPPRPRESSPPVSRMRPPARRPPSVFWTWSAGAFATHARAPDPSWGARVHVELSRQGELDRLAPALRLSWGWSDFSTSPEQAGEVRFRRKSLRVEGGARASFGPCFIGAFLGLDIGSLSGVAADLPRFEEVRAPWTAWTGGARVGVALVPWLALELGATLLVPVERPRFELKEPPRVAYVAPAVVFEGSVGVAAVARFR
ncbi:MAG: hypothetical protein K0S65_4332 [Labilithrix sp.]|nr:hypothetical protein [Labilithrix sp.]